MEAGLDVDLQLDLELAVEQPADAVYCSAAMTTAGASGASPFSPATRPPADPDDPAVALARLHRPASAFSRCEELAQRPLAA